MGHRLLGHDGLCANLHGHNYVFEVTVMGNPDVVGLVTDFTILKRDMRKLLDQLDHTMLLLKGDPAQSFFESSENRFMLLTRNPSAEHIASLMFNHMQDLSYSVKEVRVLESDGGWATTDRVNREVHLIKGRI